MLLEAERLESRTEMVEDSGVAGRVGAFFQAQ